LTYKIETNKTVLVAVLNWGLGHATRCMPLIHFCIQNGNKIILASDGRAAALMQREFPDLLLETLPAYDVIYNKSNMFLAIAPQLPKIGLAILKEKSAIKKLVEKYQVDVIISDNRFGCYDSKVHSIFITHQVNIKTPISIVSRVVNFFNHRFIQKYDECWVPDYEGEPNLSGELAHGSALPNIKFIDPQTRFKALDLPKKYDILVILSGPEPQRTKLDLAIQAQAKNLTDKQILIVQGKTESYQESQLAPNIKVISYLTSKALNEAICQSEVIVTRSGYSTIMDLAVLGKKAILIPTPGQTEQEYLGERLGKEGVAVVVSQEGLDLQKALAAVKLCKGFTN